VAAAAAAFVAALTGEAGARRLTALGFTPVPGDRP